jgi:hypothetical protein
MVNMQLTVSYDDASVQCDYSGELHFGARNEHGVNTKVVEIAENETSDVQMLLFNIFEDDADDDLFVYPELEGQNHLKIYLLVEGDHIILLEGVLPEYMTNLTVVNEEINSDDLLWFWPYVDYQKETISIKSNSLDAQMMRQQIGMSINGGDVSLNGLGTQSLWGDAPMFVHRTEMLGGDRIMRSMLCIAYAHSDMKRSMFGGEWWVEYRVVESYTDEYGTTSHGINAYRYTDFEARFACGDNTYVEHIQPTGRGYSRSGEIEASIEFSQALIEYKIGNMIEDMTKRGELIGASITFGMAANNLIRASVKKNSVVNLGAQAPYTSTDTLVAGFDSGYNIMLKDHTTFGSDPWYATGGNYLRVTTYFNCTVGESGTSAQSVGSLRASYKVIDPFELTEETYSTGNIPLTYTVYWDSQVS